MSVCIWISIWSNLKYIKQILRWSLSLSLNCCAYLRHWTKHSLYKTPKTTLFYKHIWVKVISWNCFARPTKIRVTTFQDRLYLLSCKVSHAQGSIMRSEVWVANKWSRIRNGNFFGHVFKRSLHFFSHCYRSLPWKVCKDFQTSFSNKFFLVSPSDDCRNLTIAIQLLCLFLRT